LNISRFL